MSKYRVRVHSSSDNTWYTAERRVFWFWWVSVFRNWGESRDCTYKTEALALDAIQRYKNLSMDVDTKVTKYV